MNRLLILPLLLCAFQEGKTVKIEFREKEREYRIVVPKDLKTPAPLVFAFHGLLDSKDTMPVYTKLDDLAKKEKFILVYPNGETRAWPIWRKDHHEFDFFDAVYEAVTKEYKVDKKRVYVTGMSNGAIFSHLLAAERSEKIAAVAAHSGWLGFIGKKIGAKRKYPVMIIHGGKDPIIPIGWAKLARHQYEKEKHEVEWVEFPEFGHGWAGKHDINAKIWAFFKKNPMK